MEEQMEMVLNVIWAEATKGVNLDNKKETLNV
jgi:hypothetical protein